VGRFLPRRSTGGYHHLGGYVRRLPFLHRQFLPLYGCLARLLTCSKLRGMAEPARASEIPLYDQDLYAWSEDQARLLKARSSAGLDWDNLAEEIRTLGRSERSLEQGRSAHTAGHRAGRDGRDLAPSRNQPAAGIGRAVRTPLPGTNRPDQDIFARRCQDLRVRASSLSRRLSSLTSLRRGWKLRRPASALPSGPAASTERPAWLSIRSAASRCGADIENLLCLLQGRVDSLFRVPCPPGKRQREGRGSHDGGSRGLPARSLPQSD
jgi:hypothetical protein